MRRLSCRLGVLLGLLVLPVLWGCRAMPLQIVKPEGKVDLQRYATLVVKDFQNGVGDALPSGLLQELPIAVITHLNACYPLTFSKMTRTATGSAEELILGGTIAEEYEDSGEESRPRRARLLSKVILEDGQRGKVLLQINGELRKVPGTVPHGKNLLIGTSLLAIDAVTGVAAGTLVAPMFYDFGPAKIDVDTMGRQIADAIAEHRGVTKQCVSQTDERR